MSNHPNTKTKYTSMYEGTGTFTIVPPNNEKKERFLKSLERFEEVFLSSGDYGETNIQSMYSILTESLNEIAFGIRYDRLLTMTELNSRYEIYKDSSEDDALDTE